MFSRLSSVCHYDSSLNLLVLPRLKSRDQRKYSPPHFNISSSSGLTLYALLTNAVSRYREPKLGKLIVRTLFGKSKKPDKSLTVPREAEIKNELIRLEPIELVSGFYRKDVIDRLGGDNDPYSVKSFRRGIGTEAEPNMIPSAFDSRIVGCICEEDSGTIVWMWLHKGEPKKCQCGFWFQLFYEAPFPDKETLVQ